MQNAWFKIKVTFAVLIVVATIIVIAFGIDAVVKKYEIGMQAQFEKKTQLKFSVKEYYSKPFVVEIPVRYELTIGDGLHIDRYTDCNVTPYMNRREECDDTPNHTATGRIVCEGMVALSQDFIKEHKAQYGDIIYIEKLDKYFILDDCMNERHKKAVDIFFFKSRKKDVDKIRPFRSDIYILSIQTKQIGENYGKEKKTKAIARSNS